MASKKYVAIAIVVAIAVVASAVLLGQQSSRTPETRTLNKIAVVTDGLFTDRGWGTASFEGAKFLEAKYEYEVAYEDNVAISDIESTLERYAEADYDLIIAHGFQWGDPALRVGKQYPSTKFVIFTGLVKSDNVASIFPMQQEGTFLLGALAGMTTKTGVIGYVGGDEYPNLVNIFEGYKQGAKHVKPDVKVVGTFLNDWDNPAKGKEAGISIIRQYDVDVLLHVADLSGQGVIQAAREEGVYALGAVRDQNELAPDTVLSSFVLDTEKAYDQAVQMVAKNNFRGEIFKPGIEPEKGGSGDGIVYLAPFHNSDGTVPEEVKTRLAELMQEIQDRKIIVPERYEESP